MGSQLIEGAVGTAAGVLTYSIICILSSGLLIWLLWTHGERFSFVGFIAVFTTLSTLASIIQQIHTIVDWRDIKIEQWENEVENVGTATIAIAGPSTGADLVLFFIQYYAYNVTSLLVLFWAGALIDSIFGFASLDAFKAVRNRANNIAKGVAILLPVVLISLLQAEPVQKSTTAFLVVANINILLSLSIGGILLLVALGKYIHARRQFVSWNVRYGETTNTTVTETRSRQHSTAQDSPRYGVGHHHKGIYDQWLMVRFSIAFVMLGIFELTTILFQIGSIKSSSSLENIGSEPNLTAEKAKSDFLFFMPGVTASLLTFVVFGTTKPFRETMKNAFVPKRFIREQPAQITVTPYTGQNKTNNRSEPIFQDDMYSPSTEYGSAIQLREMQDHETRGYDDELPILAMNNTRVNGRLV